MRVSLHTHISTSVIYIKTKIHYRNIKMERTARFSGCIFLCKSCVGEHLAKTLRGYHKWTTEFGPTLCTSLAWMCWHRNTAGARSKYFFNLLLQPGFILFRYKVIGCLFPIRSKSWLYIKKWSRPCQYLVWGTQKLSMPKQLHKFLLFLTPLTAQGSNNKPELINNGWFRCTK